MLLSGKIEALAGKDIAEGGDEFCDDDDKESGCREGIWFGGGIGCCSSVFSSFIVGNLGGLVENIEPGAVLVDSCWLVSEPERVLQPVLVEAADELLVHNDDAVEQSSAPELGLVDRDACNSSFVEFVKFSLLLFPALLFISCPAETVVACG
jgi:hypothetical protein